MGLAIIAFIIAWKNKYPKKWLLLVLMLFLRIVGFPLFIYNFWKNYAVTKGYKIEEEKDWKFWLAIVLMCLLAIVGVIALFSV